VDPESDEEPDDSEPEDPEPSEELLAAASTRPPERLSVR
jgi:hypothetical protein